LLTEPLMRRLGDSWVARYLVTPLPVLPPAPDAVSFNTPFALVVARLSAAGQLGRRCWGSAYLDDPWPSSLPSQLSETVESELRERFAAQQPGLVPRLTWLLPSTAVTVGIEDHEDAVVLAVRAAAGAAPATARTLLSRLATLTALKLDEEAQLIAELEQLASGATTADERRRLRWALGGLGAIWHSDLRLLGLLRQVYGQQVAQRDATVRQAIIAAASRAGYRLFLHELLADELDPLLRRVLRSLTAFPGESP
jgi:hypothetical protein